MQKLLLLFIANFVFVISFSQKLDWKAIDKDIVAKKELVNLYQSVEVQKKIAYQNKDYGFAGRCLQTQMIINDIKKEDTSYFKNSFFIDSIINSDAAPILKSVMHIMQARRLAYFKENYFYRSNKNLFRNKTGTTNYAAFTKDELDSIIELHVDKAVAISKQENVINGIDFLWLSNDPLQFFFKPKYSDIITAEQISFTTYHLPTYGLKDNTILLEKNVEDFLQLIDTLKTESSTVNKALKIYKNWAIGNKENKEAYYFIELVVRKFLNKNSLQNTKTIIAYQAYLDQQIKSPLRAVQAFSVYQRCLFLNAEAANYRNEYSFAYDTSFRFNYVKALKIYTENKSVLDSFGVIKDVLEKMSDKIRSNTLKINTTENHLPNEKVSINTTYKNIDTIYLKVVRGSALKRFYGEYSKNMKYINNLPKIMEKVFPMPVVDDYQEHKSTLDIEGLSVGSYYILYAKNVLNNDNKNIQSVKIEVSNIAILNNDSKVFVLNRTTGFPLQNASLTVQFKNKLNQITSATKKVNAAGFAIVNEKNVEELYAVCNGDTTVSEMQNEYQNKEDDLYDGKNASDLMDYYIDNMKVHMYTDRSIYRPGQTVFYKGIITTKNPKTDELMVLNKQNLKLPFFAKLFNSDRKDFFKGKKEMYILNPFGDEVDTIKMKVNDYGSFTGSFKIPTDAATGEWEFDTDDIDEIKNNSSFKVEEYKRPTFELSLEKPTVNVQVGDDFIAKAKVKSLAGALLSNTKIEYTVTAYISAETYDSITKEIKYIRIDTTIIDTTGFTNDIGTLDIKIVSDVFKELQLKNDKKHNASFTIHAEAIDATGESHEEELKIEVNNRPVIILVNANSTIEKSDITPIKIFTKESFSAKPIDKKVEVKLYKIEKEQTEIIESIGDFAYLAGQWIYNKPKAKKPTVEDKEILIHTTTLNSNTEKYVLPKELLFAGNYKIVTTCTEQNTLLGESIKTFALIDKNGTLVKGENEEFYYLNSKVAAPGEKIEWLVGNKATDIYSIYHAAYFQKNKKGFEPKYEYDIKAQKKGVQSWIYTMPANTSNKIILTHVYVLNGELYQKEETIFPTANVKESEIIVEQYRTILTPGSKEKFVVSVKTKNENIAAEIITTMYDAALDRIEKHRWDLPKIDNEIYFGTNWNYRINNQLSSEMPWNSYRTFKRTGAAEPLYWLNPLDYVYSGQKSLKGSYSDDFNPNNGNTYKWEENDYVGDWNNMPNISGYLMGRVPGVSIMNTVGFDVVVVTGLGSSTKYKFITGSSLNIVIRGLSTLGIPDKPLVILDGAVYTWALDKIDANTINEAMVLKGADATALYGAKAANGVLILSTKGPIVLPTAEAPPVVIRKNFSESAFFFPQVHADAGGMYSFTFTMPESVTEWKWKILSHTKNAIFSKIEKTIFTQLPLMVQPNMPRFLCQGDKINLQSRITNLDSVNINGNSYCSIEDAVTGENITAQFLNTKEQKFALQKKSNSSVAYSITVPENFIHPIKIKVSASSNNFSDGEEYTIPIMSKKILVALPQQIVFSSKDTSINTPTLPADATAYGISLHIKPKPQAALLNALPYMAFYQFNCAEQTFNKLLAHSLAVGIMQKDSSLQKMQKTKNILENNTEALPTELSEQTMPWLQLNNSVAKQSKDLNTLLDSTKSIAQIKKYFEEVYALQNTDGGIAWFKKGKSDAYISTYILKGFGKLQKDKIFFIADDNKYKTFIKTLVAYCDAKFLDSTNKNYTADNLMYLNARKYHTANYPLPANAFAKIDTVLAKQWRNVNRYSLEKQAVLIQASLFYDTTKNNFSSLAKKQLESIKQLANEDAVSGIRWKALSNKDDITTSDEEAIVAIAEAFEANGNDKATIDGIIKWLLFTKENHNWSTTKSTADVVTLLDRNPNYALKNTINISANVGRIKMNVSDNLLNGNLSEFAQTTFPPKINLKKDVTEIAIGNFNYYYFTATPPVSDISAGVKISKTMYRINNDKEEVVNENTILKIADKIKTVITIENNKQLKYVYIDEKRAATLEPKDAISGYEYAKGFSYYQSVRDASYQFFAEQIPSGINTITYYTTVAKEGSFYNGVVALQCMYSPALKAYGNGSVIKVVQ